MSKAADAIGAYCQTYLKGTPTWVILPANRWPKHWNGKCKNPVVCLVLALYGHPAAGGWWNIDYTGRILTLKWKPLHENWPKVFWREDIRAMLIVYVDDFKIDARVEHHDQLWADIGNILNIGPESAEERFLGCEHERFYAQSCNSPRASRLKRIATETCPHGHRTPRTRYEARFITSRTLSPNV